MAHETSFPCSMEVHNAVMEADHPEAFELYKLAVEMADRMSARRGSANAFFLTAETTLVTAQGVAFASLRDMPWPIVIALTLAGVGLSLAWWLQLRSYGELARAKFTVIMKLEEALPKSIYGDEWAVLEQDRGGSWRRRHSDLGAIERLVPLMFALLFCALAIGVLSA